VWEVPARTPFNDYADAEPTREVAAARTRYCKGD
jgi:hypothetical protein